MKVFNRSCGGLINQRHHFFLLGAIDCRRVSMERLALKDDLAIKSEDLADTLPKLLAMRACATADAEICFWSSGPSFAHTDSLGRFLVAYNVLLKTAR